MNSQTSMSTPRLTPEFALAVACCSHAIGVPVDLETLAAKIEDDRFLAVLKRHRIEGLSSRALAGMPALRPSMASTLERLGHEVAEEGLRVALQCRELRDAFAADDVDMIFLKGLVTGKLAFGNALVKRSWDIDILVQEQEVSRAAIVLKRLGYVPEIRADVASWHRVHKESTWMPPDGAPVELHSRLADNRSLLPGIGPESPRQHVEVVPGLVLPTLSGDELTAYLAVHGASSAWFRLKWITELAGIVRQGSAGTVGESAGRLSVHEVSRAVGQALLLANRLFGSPVSPRVCSEPMVKALTRVAMAQMSNPREPTGRPLGTATIHLSQLLLQPGVGFKAREAGRQAREIVHRHLRQ
ncbi:nucleotidyltransferase family protein [Sphingomonas arenae]|uniref:nucleotidyltransferase family protein n=1 Tax=Sphingomonas arenae TaxID=2812555 RepID=UPI0019677481|nr:nucleotidyltransferase family protein [Sphingomonas arenae]